MFQEINKAFNIFILVCYSLCKILYFLRGSKRNSINIYTRALFKCVLCRCLCLRILFEERFLFCTYARNASKYRTFSSVCGECMCLVCVLWNELKSMFCCYVATLTQLKSKYSQRLKFRRKYIFSETF